MTLFTRGLRPRTVNFVYQNIIFKLDHIRGARHDTFHSGIATTYGKLCSPKYHYQTRLPLWTCRDAFHSGIATTYGKLCSPKYYCQTRPPLWARYDAFYAGIATTNCKLCLPKYYFQTRRSVMIHFARGMRQLTVNCVLASIRCSLAIFTRKYRPKHALFDFFF